MIDSEGEDALEWAIIAMTGLVLAGIALWGFVDYLFGEDEPW